MALKHSDRLPTAFSSPYYVSFPKCYVYWERLYDKFGNLTASITLTCFCSENGRNWPMSWMAVPKWKDCSTSKCISKRPATCSLLKTAMNERMSERTDSLPNASSCANLSQSLTSFRYCNCKSVWLVLSYIHSNLHPFLPQPVGHSNPHSHTIYNRIILGRHCWWHFVVWLACCLGVADFALGLGRS